MVGNYYKPGPATAKSKQSRIVEPYAPYGQFYVAANYVDGFPEVSQENWRGVDIENPDSALVSMPFPVIPVTDQPATEALEQVLQQAGASIARDAVDERIIRDVRNGTAAFGQDKNGIIDSQEEVGGWPRLKVGEAQPDKDLDGMPDAWEQKHKLNPDNAADASAYTLDKEYTNIEVYLNGLITAL